MLIYYSHPRQSTWYTTIREQINFLISLWSSIAIQQISTSYHYQLRLWRENSIHVLVLKKIAMPLQNHLHQQIQDLLIPSPQTKTLTFHSIGANYYWDIVEDNYLQTGTNKYGIKTWSPLI